MPPQKEKELNRHQLSTRLSYTQRTPAFLLRLQNRAANLPEEDDAEEWDGTGRPPIPQRPDDDPGSENEDSGEEKPVVVVLKEGKHLTEREVENVKRQVRGLPPLPDPAEVGDTSAGSDSRRTVAESSKAKLDHGASLAFSSSSKKSGALHARKRKAVGDLVGPTNNSEDGEKKLSKKKAKKSTSKALLSFGDDA